MACEHDDAWPKTDMSIENMCTVPEKGQKGTVGDKNTFDFFDNSVAGQRLVGLVTPRAARLGVPTGRTNLDVFGELAKVVGLVPFYGPREQNWTRGLVEEDLEYPRGWGRARRTERHERLVQY